MAVREIVPALLAVAVKERGAPHCKDVRHLATNMGRRPASRTESGKAVGVLCVAKKRRWAVGRG